MLCAGLTIDWTCSFCLNIGWLYTRLVSSNSFSPDSPVEVVDSSDHDDPNEETALLLPRRTNKSIEEFMAMSVDFLFSFWFPYFSMLIS